MAERAANLFLESGAQGTTLMSQIMKRPRKTVGFQLLKNYSWQVIFGINNPASSGWGISFSPEKQDRRKPRGVIPTDFNSTGYSQG